VGKIAVDLELIAFLGLVEASVVDLDLRDDEDEDDACMDGEEDADKDAVFGPSVDLAALGRIAVGLALGTRGLGIRAANR